jgi:hypothetical protein
VDETSNTKLYKQLQAMKSAALRIGPLSPNRRDSAFMRYRHYARLWSREGGEDDGRQD